MAEAHFSPELFEFLKDLAANNERDWFQANKARYEEVVVDPALRFISDARPLNAWICQALGVPF